MSGWLSDVAADFPRTWRPIAAIAFVVAGAASGRVLGYLLAKYEGRIADRAGGSLSRAHARAISHWASATLLMWGVHEALQVLDMPARAARAAMAITFGLGVLFAAFLVRYLLVASLGWYAADVATRTRQPVDTQFIPLIRKMATVFIFVTAAVIMLKGYGYDISTLVVSLGVGSLAIGLAMQQTLSNMIAGFTIMLDRPFRIGDRVQLSSGEIGDVMEIGLRSTRILAFDLSTVIIPNSQMVNDRIVNLSFPDQLRRPILKLGVAYGTDPDRVKKAIAEVLASVALVEKQPPPSVHFTGFGDSSMDLAVRFTVGHYRDEGAAIDAVMLATARRLAAEGIVIPYPTRVVVHGGDAVVSGRELLNAGGT
jgi:small-conductance mechanosensitive channel